MRINPARIKKVGRNFEKYVLTGVTNALFLTWYMRGHIFELERDFYKKAENQSLVASEAKPSNAATEQLVNLLNASPELAAQLLQMLTANQAGQAATA